MFGFTVAAQGGCQGRQRFRRSHGEYCQGKTPIQQPDQVNSGPNPNNYSVYPEEAARAARAQQEFPGWDRCTGGLTRTSFRLMAPRLVPIQENAATTGVPSSASSD